MKMQQSKKNLQNMGAFKLENTKSIKGGGNGYWVETDCGVYWIKT